MCYILVPMLQVLVIDLCVGLIHSAYAGNLFHLRAVWPNEQIPQADKQKCPYRNELVRNLQNSAFYESQLRREVTHLAIKQEKCPRNLTYKIHITVLVSTNCYVSKAGIMSSEYGQHSNIFKSSNWITFAFPFFRAKLLHIKKKKITDYISKQITDEIARLYVFDRNFEDAEKKFTKL